MKKKIMVLLIVLVGMIIFTPNVSAAPNAIVKYLCYNGQTGNACARVPRIDKYRILYAAEGQYGPEGSTGKYDTHNMYLEMNGQFYKTFCVDPALSAPSDTEYTCTPMEDAGLEYLFNHLKKSENGGLDQYEAEVINTVAFRFYGIYAGIGAQVLDESGNIVEHSSLNYAKAAMIRYLQVRDGDPSAAHFNHNYGQFLRGEKNDNLINEAYNLANAALDYKAQVGSNHDSGNPASINTNSLTYERIGFTSNTVTYRVTSNFPMKQSEMEFTCENCDRNRPEILSWSDYSVILKVHQLSSVGDGCRFTINASIKKSGVFGCYRAQEGYQFLVVMVNDQPQNTSLPFNGRNPSCGEPECCEDAPLIRDKEGSVTNCCEETTHSYVKEYDLDDLFCYHDGLKVDKYWEKCDADSYKNLEINEYCDMYCTERVSIDIPGAITATSGRYFTLSKIPGTDITSPYIQGFKRCRIRVKYDSWERDYINAVKEEINKYNEFQLAAANYHFYVDDEYGGGYLGSETKTGTVTLTRKCSHHDSGETDPNCYTMVNCETSELRARDEHGRYICDENGQKKQRGCTRTDADVTGSYSYTYTKHHFSTSLNYQTAKSAQTTHASIKVVKDTIKPATHAEYTVDGRAGQQTAAQNKADELHCPTGQTDGTASAGTIPENLLTEESFSSKESSLEEAMNTAKDEYNLAYTNVKNLEDKLTKCDDYFNNTPAQEMYNFNPLVSFRYTQIYRNDDGGSGVSTLPINFKNTPGCQITGPDFVTGPDFGNLTYEHGTDIAADRYSGVYGENNFIGTDFKSSIVYDKNGDSFSSNVDSSYNARKIFTRDARYKAVCKWDENENSVNTLVPNGAVNEYAVANFTSHEYEYKVYLTTYDGTFQTDWSINNIGETVNGKGKFDDYIRENSGLTCSGDTATDEEMFTCTLHVEHEIIYTGKCNGITKSPADCEPVNNIEGVFRFKVADPANIFPTGTLTDTGAKIAENWTDTIKGQTVKAEIEQNGRRDLTYSPERESYKFHLTPEIMRHIKNYNVSRNPETIGGYADFNMICDCPGTAQTGTLQGNGIGCTKCRSILLSDLANNSISYEGQTYTVRAWSSQKSIDQVRNESHWR